MFKKLGIVLAALMLIVSVDTANAQIKLGVRGGVDFMANGLKLDGVKMDSKLGYTLGLALDVKVPIIGLGVETGLRYGFKDLKLEGEEAEFMDMSLKDYHYLTAPVLIKQNWSLFGLAGIYVKGGMFFNYKLSGGDLKYTDFMVGGGPSEEVKEEMQKFQKGLQAGVGVTLFKHLEIGVDYRHRLGRLYSNSELSNLNKVDRNAWTASVAYYF